MPAKAGELKDAILGGKPIIDIRYRYEYVEQDSKPRTAHANTVRTRLGYETGDFHDFKVLVEFEDIRGIGAEDYNDTINGKVLYPVVADPETTELNRLQLSYTGIPDTIITLGRQRITLDNHRFVGNVGWRQNEQTFDAVNIVNTSLPDTEIGYTYVGNVNRIFGDDHPAGDFDTDTHLIRASYAGLPLGRIGAFAYLLDIDDAPGLSSQTFGVTLIGNRDLGDDLSLSYGLGYAHQADYKDNPAEFSLDYYALEASVSFRGFQAKGAYEALEGNGTTGFQTPLATLHKFQGWADTFLTTPPQGVADLSGSVSYTAKNVSSEIQSVKFSATYHDFEAEDGGGDYGNEWDAMVSVKVYEHVTLGVKYANYNADGFGTDTEKLWVSVSFSL